MSNSSALAQRAAFTMVAALAITATLPDTAHAQRVDSPTVAPVQPPTVRIRLRGKPPLAPVRIDPADIEIIEIAMPDSAARYYQPWRGCGPIIVTTRARRLSDETLRWLRLDLPHPDPPQN
jgi:hypothetical protein